MKKKETGKLIIAIVAVLVIIAVVGGATFAYWSWQTSTEQQTDVSVTVEGGTLDIVGPNLTNVGMYPTNDCDGAAALVGEATVTAVNETATDMRVTPKLRGTLTAKQGTLNTTNKGYLKWALVDTTTTTTKTCDNPDYSGTLASVTTNTDFNITNTAGNTLTFIATANATTTKKYKVFIWLDETYTFTNTGTAVTDPMQDLTISVRWSQASTMIQE